MDDESVTTDPCPAGENCCHLRTPELYLPNNATRENKSQQQPKKSTVEPNDYNFTDCGQGINYIRPKIMSPESDAISLGEFPWLVAILENIIMTDGSETLKFKCWGSLVHPKAVLTATHCVKS